jgi:hypothetical protein
MCQLSLTTELTTHRSWGSEMVHIYVGQRKVNFSLHKKLLGSASPFFDKAFNAGFHETATGEMILPDVDPYVFQGFMNWLYAGMLGNLAPDSETWSLAELVDLYLFSVAKFCNGLKKDAMDAIQDLLNQGDDYLGLSIVQKIYNNTFNTEDAPIRKFCCAMIRWH